MMFYKCVQKCHLRKDCPNSAGANPNQDLNDQLPQCSPHTTVTQTVTASY